MKCIMWNCFSLCSRDFNPGIPNPGIPDRFSIPKSRDYERPNPGISGLENNVLTLLLCVKCTHRLFRAQRWHVQFLVIWTFWFQVTTISQAFMVHKNFQLFSAVLVANEHTHFGDMSSFVQDLAKSDCTKVTSWTCHLCALQVFGFAQHKRDMSMVDT